MTVKKNKKKFQLGASLVEYGLLIALIAVVVIPAVRRVGLGNRCKLCAAQLCINQPSLWCTFNSPVFVSACLSNDTYANMFSC